jgi:hypothetical protein
MSNVDLSILPSSVLDVDRYEVADLVRRSTITQIKSNLQAVSGKPTMKFMLNGCNRPPGFI